MILTISQGIVWVLLCGALFYAGGFNFIVVSLYNAVDKGYPQQANNSLWSVTLPVSTHLTGKLNDELLRALPADATGMKEIGGLPFFAEALPMFVVSMILEIVLTLLRGKPWYNFQDTVSSLSAGLLNQTAGAMLSYVTLFPYMYIYEHFRLVDLSDNRLLLWIVAFVGIDFGYYWFHRMAHELNALWALHEVHHSSEDYNLSTALRQTVFAGLDGFIFYLPLAPFVPPYVASSHKAFNLLWQFWIHTRHIPKLPYPVEFLFNTPSHHRVHHGRNPWCIDCNYGGTLIVWDRLFGTFQEEREDDSVCYGIIPPLKSWDPWAAQLHHHSEIVRRMRKTPMQEAPKNLFVGPGVLWISPKSPLTKDGKPNPPRWKSYPVPEIGSRVNPIKTPFRPMPAALYAYSSLCIVMTTVVFFTFSSGKPVALRPMIETVLTAAYVGTAVWTLGLVHDRNSVAMVLEPLRALLASAMVFWLLFWSAGVPTDAEAALAGVKEAIASLEAAPLFMQVAVGAHAVQAAIGLILLPLFVQRSVAELEQEKARLEAYKVENDAVLEARTKKHLKVISNAELAALGKKKTA